ncbi:hypothetical protein DYB36_013914 [Aphanomyces astaci]|uniref:Uncharacterized protein n=1 Tax=Aphanomyces astaci TaxID=112090 RepID=A0A396ZUN3_APHAT|nr:hypothetical protein DYB36_013914 [Aphanomyces astaci]
MSFTTWPRPRFKTAPAGTLTGKPRFGSPSANSSLRFSSRSACSGHGGAARSSCITSACSCIASLSRGGTMWCSRRGIGKCIAFAFGRCTCGSDMCSLCCSVAASPCFSAWCFTRITRSCGRTFADGNMCAFTACWPRRTTRGTATVHTNMCRSHG